MYFKKNVIPQMDRRFNQKVAFTRSLRVLKNLTIITGKQNAMVSFFHSFFLLLRTCPTLSIRSVQSSDGCPPDPPFSFGSKTRVRQCIVRKEITERNFVMEINIEIKHTKHTILPELRFGWHPALLNSAEELEFIQKSLNRLGNTQDLYIGGTTNYYSSGNNANFSDYLPNKTGMICKHQGMFFNWLISLANLIIPVVLFPEIKFFCIAYLIL